MQLGGKETGTICLHSPLASNNNMSCLTMNLKALWNTGDRWGKSRSEMALVPAAGWGVTVTRRPYGPRAKVFLMWGGKGEIEVMHQGAWVGYA